MRKLAALPAVIGLATLSLAATTGSAQAVVLPQASFPSNYNIGVSDVCAKAIFVYGVNTTTWTTSSSSYIQKYTNNWGSTFADIKFRKLPKALGSRTAGTPVVLSTTPNGTPHVTMTDFTGTTPFWYGNVTPSSANPHAVELLPNGTVVVANSDGGTVQTFNPWTQANGGTPLHTYTFNNAHGVMYNPTQNKVYVIGGGSLRSYTYSGTALTLSQTWNLPGTSPGGHDLNAMYGSTKFMLFTTQSNGIWSFDPTVAPGGGAFTRIGADASGSLGYSGVPTKSISLLANGMYLWTKGINASTRDCGTNNSNTYDTSARIWNSPTSNYATYDAPSPDVYYKARAVNSSNYFTAGDS
jgi:hypothetical protein